MALTISESAHPVQLQPHLPIVSSQLSLTTCASPAKASKTKQEVTNVAITPSGSAGHPIQSVYTPSSLANTPLSSNTPKSLSTPATASSKTTPSKKTPLVPPYLKLNNGKHTYLTMAFEAIRHLADRTGSSNPAIAKYMRSKFNQLQKTHPNHFRTSLAKALKTGVKEKQLIKIKASYKINAEWVKKEKTKIRQRENEKKAKERKRKKEFEKFKFDLKKKETEKKRMDIKIIELEKIRKEKEIAEEARKKMLEVVTEEQKLELERKVCLLLLCLVGF